VDNVRLLDIPARFDHNSPVIQEVDKPVESHREEQLNVRWTHVSWVWK